MGPHDSRTRAEIIGVAKTGKYQSLGEDPKAFFYRPLLQEYQPGVQLIVRTAGDQPIVDALRHEVPDAPIRAWRSTGIETLEQHMQLPLFPARAAGLLLGLFGLLALTLAVVGLYRRDVVLSRSAHARDWCADGARGAASRRHPPGSSVRDSGSRSPAWRIGLVASLA